MLRQKKGAVSYQPIASLLFLLAGFVLSLAQVAQHLVVAQLC